MLRSKLEENRSGMRSLTKAELDQVSGGVVPGQGVLTSRSVGAAADEAAAFGVLDTARLANGGLRAGVGVLTAADAHSR